MSDSNRQVLDSLEISNYAEKLGAVAVGFARSEKVEAWDKFLEWLVHGHAAEMDYLKKYKKERFDPANLLPGAKTVIAIGVNHYTENDRKNPSKYKVARFARGEDYHHILRKMLKKLRQFIVSKDSGISGRICVDTAPFMDKYWAARAGLGWQGKHTNLISRKYGNWLSLGSLIIDAEVNRYDEPLRDYCGTCTRCLEACPTGALVKPYLLDSNLCISYWTVETKKEKIPPDIAENLNGYIFGCDICLEVCPFNRGQRPTDIPKLERHGDLEIIEQGRLEAISEEKFDTMFSKSMLNRRGLSGILKNLQALRNARK